MTISEDTVTEFLVSAAEAAKTILEIAKEDGFIHLFSHLDADGIAAAGIMGKALSRLDAKFRLRVTQWVDEKIFGEIMSDQPQLIILTDFGSGYLELLDEKIPDSRVVIIDHHQITGNVDNENFIQVNPHRQGIPGATDVSGSGVAYFVAKAIDPKNVDLSPIALVGALGDLQDKNEEKKLIGLNEIIVKDAVNSKLVEMKKDLTFFGRETRPIHKALTTSNSPFIPGLSGEEEKSLAFLANLGIEAKENEKWRALRDLNEDEKRKLILALGDYLKSKGLDAETANLMGYIYSLLNEEPWTPLRDAREFAVLLNSTGRLDRPSLGIAICMGDRQTALDEANQILEDYRRSISTYLGWVLEKPERMEEMENIYVIHGRDAINEKIVGTISSILSTSLSRPEKPLIAYANVKEEEAAKFSARTTDAALQKGVNLGEVMLLAAEKFEGKGGGHNVAAGAQVSIENINDFLKTVDDLVGRQLKGEKIGSNDHTEV